ncbi:hypothetical protein AMAG_04736 [Allomyces macrogynus ATCC 38327]|uniref:Uncharacterized protein n=1 Tax=Allomyces macrogynus (strain ATCC 38327) TaxID=578462 RepID=A0A0L0S648_ALLM3|nr:hypothetical protein AMAG_04736 [Allomyces macrogynus ATCC 38327]|eukprot:KNE57891.1 hypothetical protein AMAG_04736 [Allomyces macrogynus ATCC 38327]
MADTVMPPPHATRSTMVRTRSMTRRLAAAEPPMLPFAPPPLPPPAAVPLAPTPPASSAAAIAARRLVRASVAAVTVYTATALALNALGLAKYDGDRHVVTLGCVRAGSPWCSRSVVEIPAQWLPLAPRARTLAVDSTATARTPECASVSEDAGHDALVRQEVDDEEALQPTAPTTPPPPPLLRPHDADPADDALRKPRHAAPPHVPALSNADRASESLPDARMPVPGPDNGDHAPRHAVVWDPTLAHGPAPVLPPPGPPPAARDPLPRMHPTPDSATLIRIPIFDRTDVDPPHANPASAPVRRASPLSQRPARPVAPRVHDDAPSRVPPSFVETPIADPDPVVDPIHAATADLHASVPVHASPASVSPRVASARGSPRA